MVLQLGLCVCVCVVMCAYRLLACLAHCQWLAYSAPNSCKVPSSPPWTNSCRSCPLRCAQTLHCMCVSVCVFMCVCVFVFVCVCVCTRVCVRWKDKESRTVQLIEHMMQMIYMHYFMRWCIFVAVVSSHTG